MVKFYIHGRLGKYLEPGQGRAKLNITRWLGGLHFELNSAIQNAVAKKNEVLVDGLRVKTNGGHVFRTRPCESLELETANLLIVSFRC